MRIFKAAAVLAACICISLLLNALLIPYQFPRMKVHRIEQETFDDLILGSSHGAAAFDPAVLTEATGRTCFNAAAGGQYPRDNYYLLLDACRGHKPGRVIWEYDPTYWAANDGMNANARYLASCMEWSKERVRYLKELGLKNDFRYTLMPWFLYKDDFSHIPRNLRIRMSREYADYGTEPFENDYQVCREDGFIAIRDQARGDEKAMKTPVLTREDEGVWALNRSYFLQAVSYCASEGIELVVAATPVPEQTMEANRSFYEQAQVEMAALSQQYGFVWIDCLQETGLGEDPFSDAEGHMHESAAAVFSGRFAAAI